MVAAGFSERTRYLCALSITSFDKYGRTTLSFCLGFYPSGPTQAAARRKSVVHNDSLLKRLAACL
jgi:hypothetical protein